MWKTINYEVCGRSHVKTATPCQDKTIACGINGVDMIALADGAGSARLSHFGAETATSSICDYIANNFNQIINNPDGKRVKIDILEYLLAKIEKASEKFSCDINDLASTLMAVAVSDNTFLILHIGDGVVGYLKNSELRVASVPENGEFANTTTFITSKDAISSIKLYKGDVNDISGFVLMSDGTAESFYNKRNKSLASVLVKMMHGTAILAYDRMFNMLKESFDSVIIGNTQDDCSIAILSRNTKVLCSYFDMTLQQKCELLNIGLNTRTINKRIKRFDDIMCILKERKTIKEISRLIHLKEKYTKRHVNSLESIGLITKECMSYFRTM